MNADFMGFVSPDLLLAIAAALASAALRSSRFAPGVLLLVLLVPAAGSAEPGKNAVPVSRLEHGLARPYPAPELAGIAQWLNSKPLTLRELRGKVVLIDFWTYSCINCVRTFPHITAWDRKYWDKGLVIIGVHSPEFQFEHDVDNVKQAMAKHRIEYPVAMDNEFVTWDRYGNRYWPAHYLIDREGQVVYAHFGEGRYEVTENNIRHLLGLGKENGAAAADSPSYSERQTHETYLGYGRAERFASEQRVERDRQAIYRFPASLAEHAWALNGPWRVKRERIVAGGGGAALRLRFHARKVFLVMGTEDGKAARVTVTLNGRPLGALAGKDAPGGVLRVEGNTLYELVDQQEAKDGVLELRTDDGGVEAYAFTFG